MACNDELRPRSRRDSVLAASHFRRVDLHEVGPVWSADFGGMDAETALKRGADLLRVEVGTSADFMDGDVALRLPVAEGAEAGPGVLAGKDDPDAVLCADKLRVVW